MAGRTRSSNHRSSLAVLLGLAAVLAVPAGVGVAQASAQIALIDAAWAIPIAFGLGVAALVAGRSARARLEWTLGRAGGEGRVQAARILGTIGICIAISASISVGFYELLLHFEK